MFKNYFKIAFRNLLRNKLFSILNISGLVIGMVACLLILQYVRFETSYDISYKNAKDIYRVRIDDYENGRLAERAATTYINTGVVMVKHFPEVINQVTIRRLRTAMLGYKQKLFKEKDLYFVDKTFFDIFSLPLIEGNPKTALSKPRSIVLTKAAAAKYFPNEDPMGKTLEINGRGKLVVTGLVAAPPLNSHLKFDFLVSSHRLREVYKKKKIEWYWSNFHVYVLTRPQTSAKSVEAKFPALFKQYMSAEDLGAVKFHMQKLTDIHITSGIQAELTPSGNAQALYLLLVIAIFILLIAWINYVNLATARATDRAREVGIRKVVGAYRKQLIIQFLGEAFFINLLACLFTVLLADFLGPFFERFTERPIQFNMWQNPQFWGIFGAMFFTGILLSGLYPAFVLSSFKPVTVLKGKIIRSPKGVMLRKGLTLFQFAASIILIGGTITVYQQLTYMRSKDLGIDISQTLIIEGPRSVDSTFIARTKTFTQKVTQLSPVKSLTSSSCIPGQRFSANISGIKLKEQSGEGFLQSLAWIDAHYIPAYDLKLVAGRNFSAKNKADYKKSVIINESSAKLLGKVPKELINKKLICDIDKENTEFTIVGVVSDYHQKSLKEATRPLVLHYQPYERQYYSVKLNTSNIKQSVASIKQVYLQMFPKNTFEYYFLDVAYDTQYRADEKFGQIFAIFSGLAIFVACMGLFGLASFTLLQRTKEVGIRKVLGASVNSLMLLLLRDFLKPIVLAGILAFPLMYWGVTEWLQNFAYHIQPGWWLLILPLLTVSFVALFTVGFQTLKATRNNPIDSLRYE